MRETRHFVYAERVEMQSVMPNAFPKGVSVEYQVRRRTLSRKGRRGTFIISALLLAVILVKIDLKIKQFFYKENLIEIPASKYIEYPPALFAIFV